MYRAILFVACIVVPIVWSWWLFIPLAMVCVFLAKFPYEIIFAGIVLDSIYYFGDSIWKENILALFASILIIFALFLDTNVRWRKLI